MTLSFPKAWREALPILLVALIVSILLLAIAYKGTAYPGDHSQILQRYAAQVGAGNGLVFNAGERILLIPSPIYMILLAVFGIRILFVISLMLAAISLFYIARYAGLSSTLAVLSAIAGLLTWPLWMGIQTAYPLMAALCLLAMAFAFSEQWVLAGFITALAVFCSPEAALLGILLFILALNKEAGWRFSLALVLPVILAVILLFRYYGPSFFEGLLLLKPDSGSAFNSLELAVGIAMLCVAAWAWWRDRTNPVVALSAAWIALYLLIVGGLLHSSEGWCYAPIASLVALLVVFRLRSLNVLWQSIGSLVIFAALMASSFIAANGGSVKETLIPSPIGVTAMANLHLMEQSLPSVPLQGYAITLDGQTNPDLKLMLERGDQQSPLVRYAPDVIAFDPNSPLLDWTTTDNWRRLKYVPLTVNSYHRKADIGDFVAYPLDLAYGPHLKLTGVALDEADLKPGDLLRVRLDWQIVQSANTDVGVDLWLNNEDWVYAHTTDTYPQTVFAAGNYSTYHTLTLDQAAPGGQYLLQVRLLISDGVIPYQTVASITVNQ